MLCRGVQELQEGVQRRGAVAARHPQHEHAVPGRHVRRAGRRRQRVHHLPRGDAQR